MRQIVTLWDPFTVTLRHTLLCTPPADHVRSVSSLSVSLFFLDSTHDELMKSNTETHVCECGYKIELFKSDVDLSLLSCTQFP